MFATGFVIRPGPLVTVLLLVTSLGGCGDTRNGTLVKAGPGPIPSQAQRPGDPNAGYDLLVNGGYVTCGIPYAAWRRTNPDPDGARKLPGRTGRNADLPYVLSMYRNNQGVDLVTTNCLLCHAGLFNGEPVIGLGNESLDFTNDPREAVDAVGSYVSGDAEIAAWRKWSQRVSAIAPYMITDTIGVNPASNLTLALIAHRDPQTLAWSEAPLIEPPPERPLPVSVPPWWRMSKKHAMFYNGMARGDHVSYMMMKSLVCADSADDVRALDERFTDVRAYIASLQPPDYPFPIDTALAAEGEAIFDRHCSACHGTYGTNSEYPNLIIDLETVGTDPLYALQAYAESDRFMAWFNRSWYGERATVSPARGYLAPPLDGLWITAPFLHNGSVPTIAALLDSTQRPTFWTRSFESTDFDAAGLGWHYRTLDYGKSGARDPEERKRIYDTTLPGYSNRGHTFGDVLSDAERMALIEYLKTL